MPTIDQFKSALIKAHRAGDTRAAELFASKIKQMNVQAQPSDMDIPQASAILDAPQSQQAQVEMQNIQSQPRRSLGNEITQDIYATPVVGGLVKGATDLGRGALQIGAIGADAVAGLAGQDLGAGKYMDQQVQANQALYERVNPNANSAINPYEIAGSMVGGGFGGAGLKALAKNVGLSAATSPVVQEQGKEGNIAEFAKQKAIQTGTAFATMGVLSGISKIPNALSRIKKSKSETELDGIVDDLYDDMEGLRDKSPEAAIEHKAVLREKLREIREQPELFTSEKIAKSNKAYDDLQKAGVAPELNDVFSGNFQGESMAARQQQFTQERVANLDATRDKQVRNAMENIADVPWAKDIADVGRGVRDKFVARGEGMRKQAMEQAQPFYDAAKTTKVEADIANDPLIKRYSQDAAEKFDELISKDSAVNSIERLSLVKRRLQDDISKAKREGDNTLAAQYQSKLKRLDDALKQDPNFAQAEKFYKDMYDAKKMDEANKFGSIARSKDQSGATVARGLMTRKTTPEQFDNIIAELDDTQKTDLLDSYLKDTFQSINDVDGIDQMYNKIMTKGDMRTKIEKLAGGRSSDTFKQIKIAMEAAKNLKMSKAQYRNSTTAQKLASTEQQKELMQSATSAIFNAKVGNMTGVVSNFVSVIKNVLPEHKIKDQTLSLSSKQQDAFMNMFVNPKNTKKMIRAISRLQKASKPEEVRKILSDYPRLKSAISVGLAREAADATQ